MIHMVHLLHNLLGRHLTADLLKVDLLWVDHHLMMGLHLEVDHHLMVVQVEVDNHLMVVLNLMVPLNYLLLHPL